jgi:hypothetical protein
MIASGEHSFPSEPRRVCRRGVNRPGFAISCDFPHPIAQLGVVQRHTQQMIEQGSFIEGLDAAPEDVDKRPVAMRLRPCLSPSALSAACTRGAP